MCDDKEQEVHYDGPVFTIFYTKLEIWANKTELFPLL